MVVVRGRLTPEVGAVARRALEAACDQARDADATAAAADNKAAPGAEADAPSLAQRQADALGVIAECALSGGLDRGTAGDGYQVVVHVDAGALTEAPDLPEAPDVPAGTSETASLVPVRRGAGQEARAVALRRADRGAPPRPCPTLVRDRVGAASTPAGRRQTVLDEAGGIHISTETARRLACDASTVGIRHGPAAEIVAVGRRTRTISPALHRALNARDRQCRFPGCRNVRVDGHHIRHWAHGGATALDNLVLLCRRHHRAVHEEGFRVTLDAAGNVEFVPAADGRPLPEAPAPPDWTGRPLAPVRARLEREGIEIGPDTLTPDWRGERLDLDWVIHQLWRPRLHAQATCKRQAADQS